jgi:hypothetical protein
MISAIACSIYILYLYRKLNATAAPEAPVEGSTLATLRAQVGAVNARIDALEKQLSVRQGAGVTP